MGVKFERVFLLGVVAPFSCRFALLSRRGRTPELMNGCVWTVRHAAQVDTSAGCGRWVQRQRVSFTMLSVEGILSLTEHKKRATSAP